MVFSNDDSHQKRKPIRQSRAPRGKLLESEREISKNAIPGKVEAIFGNQCLVSSGEFNDQLIECRIAGRLVTQNLNSNIIATGDNIYFEICDNIDTPILNKELSFYGNRETKKKGIIVSISDRISKLSRKAAGKYPQEHVIASNVDNLLIFMSAIEPKYNLKLIDRYLVSAELGVIKPIICINKIDLINIESIDNDFSIYRKLNIPLFYLSALNNYGIDELISYISWKDSVMSGPSGTGKSTFINNILGDNVQKVEEISLKHLKGKHKTTFSMRFKFPNNTGIIDTPGIREFGLWNIDKDELHLYFHEFDCFNNECKYRPCTHIHEPGCSIINAIENGKVDFPRYESYLNMYDTLD